MMYAEHLSLLLAHSPYSLPLGIRSAQARQTPFMRQLSYMTGRQRRTKPYPALPARNVHSSGAADTLDKDRGCGGKVGEEARAGGAQ